MALIEKYCIKVAKYRRQRGFTLLELMIVIAIVGVLATIALTNYIGFLGTVREVRALAELKNIDQEIVHFYTTNGDYPDSLAEIGLGGIEDPWGRPYAYLNIATVKGKGKLRKDHNMVPVNTDYDLYSKGPDGKSVSPFTAKASRDDIVRANNGAFFGSVSDY